MQKKTYTVNFGSAVVVFPKKAAKKIISGEATAIDTRVLCALLSQGESKVTEAKLCTLTGFDEAEVASSLSYWRGAGVISCSDEPSATVDERQKAPDVLPVTEKSEENAENDEPKKKALHSTAMPKYSGIEISEMLDKDGGRLREMIDECQQIIGHIFRPNEVNVVLGLCDWLGLEPDYVITVFAYFVEKKPGCNVRYIEKAAIDLVNDDIITLDDLDNYIKERELYEGIAGNLRSLLGIGGRAYTKKENDMINRWASTYGYGFEIIRLAYEICCDANGKFTFAYAGKILETWYNAGVRTLEDAEKEHSAFREQKEKNSDLAKSFDTSEFFSSALSRSYKNMGTKPDGKK